LSLRLSYRFDHSPLPDIAEVGGKAQSLMRLFQSGYPVPEGFILTTSFFEPWLMRLQRIPAWEEFLDADPSNLSSICQRLQQNIEDCRLSLDQQTILTEQLSHWQTDMSLAVRSSSPEEDLQRASFAGAYRTILGVKASQVHAVMPAIVSSCLDHGLVLYKRNRGIDPTRPRLAVIIQELVPSEVSGIAFSCHPVTGDRTQVVIESYWGLGPIVVEGRVSPDHFVVDKATMSVLARTSHSGSLAEDQLQALVTLLLDIERKYEHPIDMEWAIKNATLFILQVRPITFH
jgi:phosphoenolpyruvate synthase/pyruvate phosphate dikinase